MIEISPITEADLPAAAALFTGNLRALRRRVPVLPADLEAPARIEEMLARLFKRCPGAAACDGGKLVGYMGWYVVPSFRESERTAAYLPVWAHAAAHGAERRAYPALYRYASGLWAEAGCQEHAITLLVSEREAIDAWFWSGFGMLVVDAVRSMEPLGAPAARGVEIRKASAADAGLVAALEAEHRQHYLRPPIFMAAQAPAVAAEIEHFIKNEEGSIWLAFYHGEPAAMMRFSIGNTDCAEIVQSQKTASITGAYTRPQARGLRAARALIDAGLVEYAARGFTCCAVDFESLNPEAAGFWVKFFEPVCYSLMRVPEVVG